MVLTSASVRPPSSAALHGGSSPPPTKREISALNGPVDVHDVQLAARPGEANQVLLEASRVRGYGGHLLVRRDEGGVAAAFESSVRKVPSFPAVVEDRRGR